MTTILSDKQRRRSALESFSFSNAQAREFLLRRQGLLGGYRFSGARGVCGFIRQAGCIQFDPIDICGKNAELVLQSRVKGFTKKTLRRLLYEDRKLIEYFDKNMAIFAAEDWKYFARIRAGHRESGFSRGDVDRVAAYVLDEARSKGAVCSRDLNLTQTVNWSWKPTTLARAALETLYFRGDLILHHRKGAIKYYAPADRWLPRAVLEAPDPNVTDEDFLTWRVLRRIGAVGLLWARASDAWLGIDGVRGGGLGRAFARLAAVGRIVACDVDGVSETLYFPAEDLPLAEEIKAETRRFRGRIELLAPLDNLLWDRNLIRSVFGFDYKWEIYTPADQRRYASYTLPVLRGCAFAGRIALRADPARGALRVEGFWPEGGKPLGGDFDRRLRERLLRFAAFNGCERVET